MEFTVAEDPANKGKNRFPTALPREYLKQHSPTPLTHHTFTHHTLTHYTLTHYTLTHHYFHITP